MANWVNRKSKSHNGLRTTTTVNTGKGYTSSYSIGDRNSRSTFTTLPNGRIKTTITQRNGDWTMRRSFTSSGSPRKSRKKSNVKMDPIVALFVLFVIVIASIFGR